MYTLVDIEKGRVVKRDVVDNPGHAPGAIPRFLHELGVNQVICGGIGARASELFSAMGMGKSPVSPVAWTMPSPCLSPEP